MSAPQEDKDGSISLLTTALGRLTLNQLIDGISKIEDQLGPVHALEAWKTTPTQLVTRINKLSQEFYLGNFWNDIVAKNIIARMPAIIEKLNSQVVAKGGEDIAEVQGSFTLFGEFPLEIRSMIWSHAPPGPQIVEVFTSSTKCELQESLNIPYVSSATQTSLLRLRAVNTEAQAVIRSHGYIVLRTRDIGVDVFNPESVLLFNYETDTLFYTNTAFAAVFNSGWNSTENYAVWSQVHNLAIEFWHFKMDLFADVDLLEKIGLFTTAKKLTWVLEHWRKSKLDGRPFVLRESCSAKKGAEYREHNVPLLAMPHAPKLQWYNLQDAPQFGFLSEMSINVAVRERTTEDFLFSEELRSLVKEEEPQMITGGKLLRSMKLQ